VSSPVDGWKSFIKGRIAQERGDDKGALEAFDRALGTDPNNQSFLRARSNAMVRLGRRDDLVAAKVAEAYAGLASKCVGEADKPEVWAKGLEGLLAQVESWEKEGAAVEGAMMLW